MDVRAMRFLAAQCWASAGSRCESATAFRKPLQAEEVSTLCDELILIDDATVRVLTLTAMFLHHHITAYPGIVAKSLVDYRRGAMIDWRTGSIFQLGDISRAARTYLVFVVLDETPIGYGERIIQFLEGVSERKLIFDVEEETAADFGGREGWITEDDGTEVFRELTPTELTAKNAREYREYCESKSYEFAAMACSSHEATLRAEQRRSEVAAFIKQAIWGLFDDEVTFPTFWSVSQTLSWMGNSRPALGIDRLLERAVSSYIEQFDIPQSLTEFYLNDGQTSGHVTLDSRGQNYYYRRKSMPSWYINPS